MRRSFLIALVAVSCCSASAQSSSFRAAAAKVNITPTVPKQLLGYAARQSNGVHDSIYHRILVMDDGTSRFIIVSSELCYVSPSNYQEIAARVQKKFGVKPGNFWWSLTHTHSAPEVGPPGIAEAFLGDRYEHPVDTAYTFFISRSMLDGIDAAIKSLAPAKLGVGWGFSQANINRRAIDVDGKASLGLNPDGPVDRRIGLIRLENTYGQPVALLVNYAIHGTVLGQENLGISGDVAGVVAGYVEEKTGAPVLFINGAAGNLAPIYSVYPNARAGHLSQFRVLLGDKIIEGSRKITSWVDSVKLFTGAINVESPRKPGLGWAGDLQAYTRTTKDGVSLVKLPVQFLKINDDVAIWSAPIELFCEISNEVRDRSPFKFTFYCGYTNGWLGYLPTARAWEHGGYEVEVVSPFTPAAERDLTEAVVSYLEGEMKSGIAPAVKKKKNR